MSDSVLIFRIGSIGDTVVAMPCFHRVARSFPGFRRILVTDVPPGGKAAPVESVVRRGTLIDEVIYFPPPPRRFGDFLDLRTSIRATQARALVYIADRGLAGSLRDLCFFRTCGIRQIIGVPLSRDLRKLRIDPRTGETEREAERLVRCLGPLGPVELDDPAWWDLCLQGDERRAAAVALAPLAGKDFLAVCFGGKVAQKDWGDANWRALLALLAADSLDLALVFIGAAEEFERCAALAKHWPGASLNLCGRLSPRESAAAMQSALLYVGHDSGPMHLAAAVGTPCIAMFGEVNMPRWWHPMGRGHHILHDMGGVQRISPATVHAALRSALPLRMKSSGSRDVTAVA